MIFGKKILITGGAGFIGSHLVDSLIEKNEITVLDDLSSGNIQYIKNYLQKKNFSFIKGSILDKKIVEKAAKDINIIIHEAAVVGVKKYIENPLKVILTNTFGTHNVVEAALKKHVELFLLASTSEVYGKNVNMPLSEDSDRILGPTNVFRWCYSTTKALDEHMLFAYHHQNGLPIIILRYFNAYGPRQESSDYGAVIPIFIKRILSGKPPLIHGNGKQTRGFTYITDLVNGTLLALENEQSLGEIFNIGNEEEITINELANLILELTGNLNKIKPKYITYDEFYGDSYEDTLRRVADIRKAKKILKYKPKITLKEGLKKTIDWYKSNLPNLTKII
ncbi:MAG: GDP-mannose 4,6-dehydratase [Candidatus Jordarchaeum sp.]|uniref:GDP-mannose 4,6-dehydratase n=1 Tax=Candidatus Jordarchaeum sp. TaxID=2823881 RepID=UPI004049344D